MAMSKRSIIGLTLILLGVSAWPIGLWVLHLKAVPWVLTFHLSGVIPGFIIKRWDLLKRIAKSSPKK